MAGIFVLQVSRLCLLRQPDDQLSRFGEHLYLLAGGKAQRLEPFTGEGELRERLGPAAVGAIADNMPAGWNASAVVSASRDKPYSNYGSAQEQTAFRKVRGYTSAPIPPCQSTAAGSSRRASSPPTPGSVRRRPAAVLRAAFPAGFRG